jgi:hypothetical protein
MQISQGFMLKAKYGGETDTDLIKGWIVSVGFASVGYGLSAKIMGKDFTKYAIYGGMWAMFSEALALSYARYKEEQITTLKETL